MMNTYAVYEGQGSSTFSIVARFTAKDCPKPIQSLIKFLEAHPQVHDLSYTSGEGSKAVNTIIKRCAANGGVSGPL